MIKAMNGWKVISPDRMSASYNPYLPCVNYPVNIEIKPSLPGSKLFFFKDIKFAERFIMINDAKKIVPCIARNVTKPKYMMSVGYIVGFWEWKNKHNRRSLKEIPKSICYFTRVPLGTYWADSITCLK